MMIFEFTSSCGSVRHELSPLYKVPSPTTVTFIHTKSVMQ